MSSRQPLTKNSIIFYKVFGVSLGIQNTLEATLMPNSQRPIQNKLSGIFGAFLSHEILTGFIFLTVSLHMIWLLVLFFKRFLCRETCVSVSKCVSCRLIFWGECFFILFFVCFVLFQFACFFFNLSCFYLVDVCLPKQTYKGCRIDDRKGVENLRGIKKGGKYNHNIFYEKIYIKSKKE